MNYHHKELAAGRWRDMPFVEQMANIGGEIERALKWQDKGNEAYSGRAAERALELIDLTLDNLHEFARLKEVARLREAVADYFFFDNDFKSNPELWRKYFLGFAYAARRNLLQG